MKPEFIKCKLISIEDKNKKRIFKLQTEEKIVDIMVDESINRTKERIQEVLNGTRNNIYLSRCMTDIDIITYNNEWGII